MDPKVIESWFWNLVNNTDTGTKIWVWVAGVVVIFVLVVIGDYVSATRKQREQIRKDFLNMVPSRKGKTPEDEDPPAKASKREPKLTRKMFLDGTLLH